MGTTADSVGDAGQRERRLTVAAVRDHSEHADVMFHETARIYRLLRTNPQFEDAVRHLRDAQAAKIPVRVRFHEPNGEVIETVRADL
jgi:hypothetical protein